MLQNYFKYPITCLQYNTNMPEYDFIIEIMECMFVKLNLS